MAPKYEYWQQRLSIASLYFPTSVAYEHKTPKTTRNGCVEGEHMKRGRLQPWHSKVLPYSVLALGPKLVFPGPFSEMNSFTPVIPKVWSPDHTVLMSPGILLVMQILRPHSRPANSNILRVGSAICIISKPSK